MKIKRMKAMGATNGQQDSQTLHGPSDLSASTAEPLVRNILAPIDFSEETDCALEYARALTKDARSHIHLLHVLEPTPFASGLDANPLVVSDEESLARAEADLMALTEKHAAPNIHYTVESRRGHAAHEIEWAARKTTPDLLVLSTHGHNGLKHHLLGGVSEKLIRTSPTPVLVVRKRPTPAHTGTNGDSFRLRRILVPTDFTQHSVEAVRFAALFAAQFGCYVTLAHCVRKPRNAKARAQAAYDLARLTEVGRGCVNERLLPGQNTASFEVIEKCDLLSGPPSVAIPALAAEESYDLIICATHGHTGLTHALFGSTAEGIVRHARCPVLVVGARSHWRNPDRGKALPKLVSQHQ